MLLPLVPLRDVVIFPGVVTPLFVGRDKSINALQKAMADDKSVMLIAQRNADDEDPKKEDLYNIGTVSTILQLIKLPDGTFKVLVEGIKRATLKKIKDKKEFLESEVEILNSTSMDDDLQQSYINTLKSQFKDLSKSSSKIRPEIISQARSIERLDKLIDTLVGHLSLSLEDRQVLLEEIDLEERSKNLVSLLENQLDLTQMEKKIRDRVKKQMEKSQKEYYLSEQMKALKKEMGEGEDIDDEIESIEKKIKESGMPKEATEKVNTELNKFKLMPPMSAEASVVRGYIDWMISIPWKKKSKIQKNISKASDILESDHHGLEEVKERILEFLSVQKRVSKIKGPVLCLVGPPGVGKTSLGESIARATGREFIRVALGGVRDEAEIRGHRRTYIGSMPGKILQKMSKVGVKNPLFLLDEIDKIGADYRGDPSSALLEVLDPEQNHTFNDHYLEVDYDLSDVMFVCTANSLNIPGPLLDRMEIIRLPGYTEDEKLSIAKNYLVPKQLKNNGLKENEIVIEDSGILDAIRYFTREAGVRALEREIAKICRKTIKKIADLKRKTKQKISSKNIEDFLGVKKFDFGEAKEKDKIGQVTGLAWTQVGGELLTIEASAFKGKGKIIKTGKLGDVMQESIQAAISVVRSRSEGLGINPDFHELNDIHIHVPEGATPKDGPSAGIAMVTAVTSVLANLPVRADVAMTGEITLRGEVLKIGGLKEKLLAARRGGIKTVLIPDGNIGDLKEIPEKITKDLQIKPVKWIDEVFKVVFTEEPKPWVEEKSVEPKSQKNQKNKKNKLETH
ncbi:MAG: endopeptidase La [Gammaproteobacteria bacterium]|nr:MAG: endopeptidase La [Gammaproteobacteria bacterium]|tara:strand:+ start:50 stop:2434 length:2385 start_codon:yes stop_codon:yes gene_type:complete